MVGRPFQPGNPGRPKGAKNKLNERFYEALYEDFKEHGAQAVVDARTEDPMGYLRVVASVLPKDVNVSTASRPASDLNDDELGQLIAIARESLRASAGERTSDEGSGLAH